MNCPLGTEKAANTFLQLGDINDRQAQIIKMFVDNPKGVITVKDIQTKFFISATTAKGDIMGLVNRGLMVSMLPFTHKKKTSRVGRFLFMDACRSYTQRVVSLLLQSPVLLYIRYA